MNEEKNLELMKTAAGHPEIGGYLLAQNYNLITHYLHSIRYRHLYRFLSRLCVERHSGGAELKLFEIGCGYGKSLEILRTIPELRLSNYLGINIEEQFTQLCEKSYGDDKHQFITAEIQSYASGERQLPFVPDAVVSLECFEHIPERDVPGVVDWLHSLNRPLFISVPNEVGFPVLLKNLGSFLMGYSRYKEYSWRETFNAFRNHMEKIRPHGTGHIGFDWRWLAAVLNQKFILSEIGTSPWNFLPRQMSLSIYFHCQPRSTWSH